MKLKHLKQTIAYFQQYDELDVYFEDETGKVRKIETISLATRVDFIKQGSDGQMQILLK